MFATNWSGDLTIVENILQRPPETRNLGLSASAPYPPNTNLQINKLKRVYAEGQRQRGQAGALENTNMTWLSVCNS